MQDKVEKIKTIIYKNKKDHLKMMIIYFVFFVSLSVAVIPISGASVFALMIGVCTLAVIYSLRMNAEEDSLLENHATFLIRTFWRANLYLLITSFIAMLYLLISVDYAPLSPCIEVLNKHIEKADIKHIPKVIQVCNEIFIETNMINIKIMAFIAFSPILLYLLVRCVKGWTLIVQHKMVPEDRL